MTKQERPIPNLGMRRPEDGPTTTLTDAVVAASSVGGVMEDVGTALAKGVPLADQLARMSDEELRNNRDLLAFKEWNATWQFWDAELRQRATDRLNARMEALATETTTLTRATVRLTWVSVSIAVLALVVAVVALIVK